MMSTVVVVVDADRTTSATYAVAAIERVSVASDGTQANGDSSYPAVSSDGTVIAFASWADNLLPGDTDNEDVFLHDTTSGVTGRTSVASDGTPANNLVPADSNNRADVFVYDRATGTTSRVSTPSDGTEADGGSSQAAISGDGSMIAYASWAENLVPGDTNNRRDVFVHDRATGTTSRVSIATDGREANGDSTAPAVSRGGSVVAYHSHADNLGSIDTNNRSDVLVASLAEVEPEPATIRVRKVTSPSSGPTQFTFTGDVAGGIGDGGQLSREVEAGRYTSTETLPSSWDLTSIWCDDGNSSGDVGSATATFHAAPGETVTCTFTNTKDTRPVWDVEAEVSCDDIVVSWTAANVAGWHIEIGYPPWYLYWAELREPSGFERFTEPWLYGTYTVNLYDEHDDYVPGSHETFDLTQPAGCGYANVMIAGGTGVVSEQVATELGALSRSVTRLAGPDRYATAAAISRNHFPQLDGEGQPVFIATGENFPDALAGGPAAAYFGGPILLVRNHSIPPDTVMELDRIHPAWIAVLGGTGVVSQNVEDQLDAYTDGEVYRLAGPNRYATAAAISWATFDPGVDAAYVATGANFPDALAGGPAAAVRGAPILLVTKTSIPDETVDELDRLNRVGSTSWAARASSRRASPLH
jgi:hypothetical protein